MSVPEREVVALVAEAEELGSAKAFRAAALAALGRVVGYDQAFFIPFDDRFLIDAPERLRRFGSSPKYQRELARIFDAGRRDHGTYVDTLVFSTAERERLSFFREVQSGIRSTLVSAVSFRGRATGVLHLDRLGEARPFSRKEQDAATPLLRIIGMLHAAFEPRLACPPARSREERLACLTPREREVAELVSEGLQNLQIAAQLGRSAHTVRHQLESIFAKCGFYNRTDLAVAVREASRLAPHGDAAQRRMARVLDRVQCMVAP